MKNIPELIGSESVISEFAAQWSINCANVAKAVKCWHKIFKVGGIENMESLNYTFLNFFPSKNWFGFLFESKINLPKTIPFVYFAVISVCLQSEKVIK